MKGFFSQSPNNNWSNLGGHRHPQAIELQVSPKPGGVWQSPPLSSHPPGEGSALAMCLLFFPLKKVAKRKEKDAKKKNKLKKNVPKFQTEQIYIFGLNPNGP